MRYLIVQDWLSTSGNHAGMKHMCELLLQKYPNDYEVYVKECSKVRDLQLKGTFLRTLGSRLKRYIIHKREKYYANKLYIELCKPMFIKLKDGDEVFLLEYMQPDVSQYELACYIRKRFPAIKIYALSHLTCKFFEGRVNKEPDFIFKWAKPVDKLLTLGSSLSEYFKEVGIPEEKISTGFHYVDSDYYHKNTELKIHKPITIIAMGALQRDYSMLAEIVKTCTAVRWIICRGRKDVDCLFPKTDNVELKGFLLEDELYHQMDIADISLNIMEDTVGSNVITTSMAMGLAIVVTDVGSIRDYCDESNAVFCQNSINSIVEAINSIIWDEEKIYKMKKSSMRKSLELSIDRVDRWFKNLPY